jgi:hypothetical protein
MARWPKTARLVLLAGSLAFMTITAKAQTEDKPSFFKSLWSSIKGTTTGSDDNDGGHAPAATEPEDATAPSLSSARWAGFTPVIVAGEAAGEGAWVIGPFVETGGTGWVTDTVSGLTVQVRLVWREAASGSLAELSAEAGLGLGLSPGAVANVTIYLAR